MALGTHFHIGSRSATLLAGAARSRARSTQSLLVTGIRNSEISMPGKSCVFAPLSLRMTTAAANKAAAAVHRGGVASYGEAQVLLVSCLWRISSGAGLPNLTSSANLLST